MDVADVQQLLDNFNQRVRLEDAWNRSRDRWVSLEYRTKDHVLAPVYVAEDEHNSSWHLRHMPGERVAAIRIRIPVWLGWALGRWIK